MDGTYSLTTWLALVPIALLLLLVTVEVGIGLTIGNMPRNRMTAWTDGHRQRIRRVWIGVAAFWPSVGLATAVSLLAPWPIVIAFWGGVGLLIVWGLAAVTRRGRAVRYVHAGRCGGCGYDLRGTQDAVQCPECGCSLDPVALRAARRATLA